MTLYNVRAHTPLLAIRRAQQKVLNEKLLSIQQQLQEAKADRRWVDCLLYYCSSAAEANDLH